MGRFCIILKCPWPDLSDARVREMQSIDRVWYNYKMFTTLIQQCGRCTRTEDDYSVTYIIDGGAIRKLLPSHKEYLPQSFIDRFI